MHDRNGYRATSNWTGRTPRTLGEATGFRVQGSQWSVKRKRWSLLSSVLLMLLVGWAWALLSAMRG